MRRLRDSLHAGLSAALPARVHFNGDAEHRLPHTLNISIDGTSGDTILAAAPGLAASTGSACHSGHTDPSPVLTAMGVPRDLALAALRLSLGRWTTTVHIAAAVTALTEAVAGQA